MIKTGYVLAFFFAASTGWFVQLARTATSPSQTTFQSVDYSSQNQEALPSASTADSVCTDMTGLNKAVCYAK